MMAKGCCPAATSDRRVPVRPSLERLRSETNRRFPARSRSRASAAGTITESAEPRPEPHLRLGANPPAETRAVSQSFGARIG